MAYVLKEGKTIESNFSPVLNPTRRICSLNDSVQFNEEGDKVFKLRPMIGTYVDGDWRKKIDEFSVNIELPYNLGTIKLEDVYAAINELAPEQLADWESDEI